jgi:neutral trehalase
VTGTSETLVSAGYQANVVGFGWTNGVFLQLLEELPKTMIEPSVKEKEEIPSSH